MQVVSEVPLSWSRQDVEQRLAFKGGRYTRVNTLLSLLLAGILTVLFYAALLPFEGTHFASMFTDRGGTRTITDSFLSDQADDDNPNP